jgi:ubiquinone/menaquinone biosynthesis C-methylase UbiE
MIKLHLGCGKRNFGPDWVHIDGGDFSHLHSHDITKLPFENNSVDLIYSSHVLEYFDREEVTNVLKEWYRVLKIGGMLRVAVPDFKMMTTKYLIDGCELDLFLGPLYGKWSMGDKTIYHKTAYDFLSLKKVLQSNGFRGIQEYDWRNTEHSHIDDHSQSYLPHMDKENGTLMSLNIECYKIG